MRQGTDFCTFIFMKTTVALNQVVRVVHPVTRRTLYLGSVRWIRDGFVWVFHGGRDSQVAADLVVSL